MVTFDILTFKCVPALAARAPDRKVGPKLTITLANLNRHNILNYEIINSTGQLPNHEEPEGHALGTVFDQKSDILIVLLGQNGSVVQDH